MAKREETRAESIERLRKAAIRDVKAGLKKRNIAIPEIEGASEDDAALRDLQEWQAIARGFEDADKASENSASAENRGLNLNLTGSGAGVMQDTMDSASKTGKGKI
jgi:hypothetical protein